MERTQRDSVIFGAATQDVNLCCLLTATSSLWSGGAALAAAVFLAYRGKSLFSVSLAACGTVFILELFLR